MRTACGRGAGSSICRFTKDMEKLAEELSSENPNLQANEEEWLRLEACFPQLACVYFSPLEDRQ